MKKETLTITNVHISPEEISHLCEKLSKLDCRIYIEVENQRINGKSVMGMLSFRVEKGRPIQVLAEGKEESAAISMIKGLFAK